MRRKSPQRLIPKIGTKPPGNSRFSKKPLTPNQTAKSRNISFIKLVQHTGEFREQKPSPVIKITTKKRPALTKVKSPDLGLYADDKMELSRPEVNEIKQTLSKQTINEAAGDSAKEIQPPIHVSSGDDEKPEMKKGFEEKKASIKATQDDPPENADDRSREAPPEFKEPPRVRHKMRREPERNLTWLEQMRGQSPYLTQVIDWILSTIDNHLVVVIILILVSFVLYPGFMVLFVPIFVLLMYLWQPKEGENV